MSDDPERLLAEALRAQARYAPPPRATQQAQQTSPAQQTPSAESATSGQPPAPMADLSGGYGLLSGAGEESLKLRRAALDTEGRQATMSTPSRGSHRRVSDPLPAPWVLILAGSLCLAFGSIVGLLTLL